ncbi:MAG TPA: type II toxin-antitoxin system VapC family toxin [Candidatus Acidoferrales bacterium]|nr:type II toxin-antitoxin system VapC family toxin [Candidatus Acidoferrales bacterium]
MTTAIDSNVLVALWDKDDTLNTIAQSALNSAYQQANLVVSAPVYAELLAYPVRGEAFLDSFFRDSGILIDWRLDEAVWRVAGLAFRSYAARRRGERDAGPRRILADFLIGAHAAHNGFALLTLDDRLFRAAFPRLSLITV